MFPLTTRRSFLTAGTAALALGPYALAQSVKDKDKPAAAERGKPTKFQIACMTYTYSQFPLERALTGIKGAGYQYVAWGTSHKEADGKATPVMAADALPEKAKGLGK